jgi:hypothetical protein
MQLDDREQRCGFFSHDRDPKSRAPSTPFGATETVKVIRR